MGIREVTEWHVQATDAHLAHSGGYACSVGIQATKIDIIQSSLGLVKNIYLGQRQRPKQSRKKPNVATNLLAFFLFFSTIITSLHIPCLTKFVDYKVFKYGISRISTDGVCYTYWPLALLDFIPLFMRNFTRGVLCLKFVQSFNFYHLILLCLDID